MPVGGPSQSLIDVKELIEKFSISELNEAAEEYWQRLVSNPKLLAKPFNLGEAEHILPQMGFLIQGLRLLVGMTILDFGAGSCHASRILNQLGLRVISVDVSKTALEIGKGLAQRWPPVGDVPEQVFCHFDGQRLDLPDESVDRIFCLDAFHHVPDQRATLREMARVLKDGGIAGFAEPGPNHSKSSESQLEMRTCKVIENDIVLGEVLSNGRAVGFTDLKVAVSTIPPPLVSLDKIAGYWAQPDAFVQGVQDRATNFPIFFLYKGDGGRDRTVPDSRAAAGLRGVIRARSTSVSSRAGQPVTLVFDVENTSPKTWLASGAKPGCVNLGAFLHRQSGEAHLGRSKEYRTMLSAAGVEPGGAVTGVELDLGALEAGEYLLEVDLVSEHICWFQSQDQSATTVRITVVS